MVQIRPNSGIATPTFILHARTVEIMGKHLVWNLFQTEQTVASQSGCASHLTGLGQSEADFRVTRPDC